MVSPETHKSMRNEIQSIKDGITTINIPIKKEKQISNVPAMRVMQVNVYACAWNGHRVARCVREAKT